MGPSPGSRSTALWELPGRGAPAVSWGGGEAQTQEGPSRSLAPLSPRPDRCTVPRVPVHRGWRAPSTTFRSFFSPESGPEVWVGTGSLTWAFGTPGSLEPAGREPGLWLPGRRSFASWPLASLVSQRVVYRVCEDNTVVICDFREQSEGRRSHMLSRRQPAPSAVWGQAGPSGRTRPEWEDQARAGGPGPRAGLNGQLGPEPQQL